jgi:hypothetical protein
MPQVQVKKVVAVCFLEAVKLALEQLGARRLEQASQGPRADNEFPRVYGEIRRLRDYLQRCVSGYQDQVDLDLTPPDTGLLVACCRGVVDAIEQKLEERALTPDERQWLQKKLTIIADWTVELAQKPLTELPLPRTTHVPGEAMRKLTVRLQQKCFGDVNSRPKIVPPSAINNPNGSNSIAQGLPSFGEQLRTTVPTESAIAATPASEMQTMVSTGPLGLRIPDETPEPVSSTALFDHRKMRDPRLRALVGMDVLAYERCLEASDWRIATILLAAILESAVLDHVATRRTEFGLSGSPDSWNPVDLLLSALGSRANPKDRSLGYHLFAARNLLRPATQMVNPTVVTPASFDRLRDFVQRSLHGLGFGPGTQTLPPGAVVDPAASAPTS